MRIALQPGTLFHERYLISKQLGAGGMGSVYLAEQVDAKRKVALKILHADDPNEDQNDRFLREFQVLSKLNHINIVTFYSAAITEDGSKYAVTEYITGKSLQAVLQEEGRLSWARVGRICSQICDAITYANSQNIVHRDLKPANIMLVDYPNPDTVKVIDFGLAKVTSGDLMKTLTQTGEIIGSPHYMSPEQILGHPVDERSDLYSLACIVIECLAGKKLFDSTQALSIIRSHIHDDARKFLEHQFDKRDKALISTLARALSKEPGERHRNAIEFKDDLLRVCSQHESSTLASVSSNNNQTKLRTGTIIAVCCLLIFGISALLLSQKKAVTSFKVTSSDIVLNSVDQLYEDSYRLEEHLRKEQNPDRRIELFEEFRMKVRKINEYLHGRRGYESKEVENLQRLLKFCDLAADDPSIFKLETYHAIASRYMSMSDYTQALSYLEKEKKILGELKEELPAIRGRLYSDLACIYGITHHFKECSEYLPRAFKEYKKLNNETFLASDQGRAVQFLERRPMFTVANSKSIHSNSLYEVYENLADIKPRNETEAAKLAGIFNQLASFFIDQHFNSNAVSVLENEESLLKNLETTKEIELEKTKCLLLLKKAKQTEKNAARSKEESES